MDNLFIKKLVRQGIVFILICGLVFSSVFGLDKSYGQETAAATAMQSTLASKSAVETPVISKVARVSYNSLKIKWTKVSGAKGYVLYRSTSENGKYKKVAALKGSSKTSYTDEKRTVGRKYFYKVKAYKSRDGKNRYSKASAAKAGKTTPGKTKFNKNTVYGYKTVTLEWNKSKGAKGYNIYRSTGKATGYRLVKTIHSGNRLKWSNKNLNAKKTYYYKVVPYVKVNNKIVEGAASAVYKKKPVSEKIDKIIKKYKNVPYVYGGNTPRGWDCSGFTQWSAKYISGKEIPRTADAQAVKGKRISRSDRSKWQPGDILLYSTSGGGIGHAALYIGDNKIMHALNSRYDTIIQDVDFYEKWDRRTKLKYVRRYN